MLQEYHEDHREQLNLCFFRLSATSYDYLDLLGPLGMEALPSDCVQSLPELLHYVVGKSGHSLSELMTDVDELTSALVLRPSTLDGPWIPARLGLMLGNQRLAGNLSLPAAELAYGTPAENGQFVNRSVLTGKALIRIGSGGGTINDPCFTLQYLYHAVGAQATFDAWQHTFWHYHRIASLKVANCKLVTPFDGIGDDIGNTMIVAVRDLRAGEELLRIYGWSSWSQELYKIFDYLFDRSRMLGTLKFYHWTVTRCMYILDAYPSYIDSDKWYLPFRMMADWLCGVTRYLRAQQILPCTGTINDLSLDTELTVDQFKEIGWSYQCYRTIYLKQIP